MARVAGTSGVGKGVVDERQASGGGSSIDLTARGEDAEAVVTAALRAVLEAAGGSGSGATDEGSVSAPIRGQGADVAAVFGELAADLLAQLDANGPGLADVRLDGLLQTDDGGYTAWGYAIGTPVPSPPPVGLALDGEPALEEGSEGLILHFRMRRDGTTNDATSA